MTVSYYTAGVAALELQKGMDMVANNIANVSTAGYLPSAPSFSDLLYTSLQGTQARAGHGARLEKTDTLFRAGGGLLRSQRDLDFFPEDPDAFFAVQTPGGVRYTKDGSFHLSELGGVFYLTAASGGYVLDGAGQPVTVTPGAGEAPAVGLYVFDNPDGLLRGGDNTYLATDISGGARAAANQAVRAGCLAASGVNLADEMASVIQLQRAFQANTRIVQISDEIMQTINNLR